MRTLLTIALPNGDAVQQIVTGRVGRILRCLRDGLWDSDLTIEPFKRNVFEGMMCADCIMCVMCNDNHYIAVLPGCGRFFSEGDCSFCADGFLAAYKGVCDASTH